MTVCAYYGNTLISDCFFIVWRAWSWFMVFSWQFHSSRALSSNV